MLYAGSIIARELVEELFPTKLYVFRSYADLFGKANASGLLNNTLSKNPEIIDVPSSFLIAFAFGFKQNNKVEGIDIFSARLRDGWEGNPMYDSWTFENGVYVPREKGTTCGTGVIILGKEEALRRKTKDRESFLSQWPDIGDLYDPDF